MIFCGRVKERLHLLRIPCSLMRIAYFIKKHAPSHFEHWNLRRLKLGISDYNSLSTTGTSGTGSILYCLHVHGHLYKPLLAWYVCSLSFTELHYRLEPRASFPPHACWRHRYSHGSTKSRNPMILLCAVSRISSHFPGVASPLAFLRFPVHDSPIGTYFTKQEMNSGTKSEGGLGREGGR